MRLYNIVKYCEYHSNNTNGMMADKEIVSKSLKPSFFMLLTVTHKGNEYGFISESFAAN